MHMWLGERRATTMLNMAEFLDVLLTRYKTWSSLPVDARFGEGWHGSAISVPPPAGSDLAGPLGIEEVGGEVTISLDFSHIHMGWPVAANVETGNLWSDPLAIVEAIIGERIVSTSGWIDGQLRVGSLHEADRSPNLYVPNLQRIRVRSWRGNLDRDHEISKAR